jgi:beta-N-acetylglucosaminidase
MKKILTILLVIAISLIGYGSISDKRVNSDNEEKTNSNTSINGIENNNEDGTEPKNQENPDLNEYESQPVENSIENEETAKSVPQVQADTNQKAIEQIKENEKDSIYKTVNLSTTTQKAETPENKSGDESKDSFPTVDEKLSATKREAGAAPTGYQTQTNQNYELAIQRQEGLVYSKGFDGLEEASKEQSELNQPSVIIERSGMILKASSPQLSGRLYKKISGSLYTKCDLNSTLYLDSSLKTSIGYANGCYVDDVAIIEQDNNRDAAKILISGKEAWVRISTDLVILPTSQITNPSYYINENGNFVHFVSSNSQASYEKGTKLNLGKTNNQLKNGVKYYSYDGNYFYESLAQMNNDIANKTRSGATNKSAYYSYFQFLPFRSKTKLTANQINEYINSNTTTKSKLRGIGQSLINAQNQYGVNATMMLAIAINESAWGNSDIAINNNNLFGLNAVDSSPGQSASKYLSVEDCINQYAKYWISQGFADPEDARYYGSNVGNKNIGLNIKYASDPYWGEKAANFMYQISIANGNSDYNAYKIGIFNSSNNVINDQGNQIYPIVNYNEPVPPRSSYTATPIVVVGEADNNRYQVIPDRNNNVNQGAAQVPFDFNQKAYISRSGIYLINGSIDSTVVINSNGNLVRSYEYSGSNLTKIIDYHTGATISNRATSKMKQIQYLNSDKTVYTVESISENGVTQNYAEINQNVKFDQFNNQINRFYYVNSAKQMINAFDVKYENGGYRKITMYNYFASTSYFDRAGKVEKITNTNSQGYALRTTTRVFQNGNYRRVMVSEYYSNSDITNLEGKEFKLFYLNDNDTIKYTQERKHDGNKYIPIRYYEYTPGTVYENNGKRVRLKHNLRENQTIWGTDQYIHDGTKYFRDSRYFFKAGTTFQTRDGKIVQRNDYDNNANIKEQYKYIYQNGQYIITKL